MNLYERCKEIPCIRYVNQFFYSGYFIALIALLTLFSAVFGMELLVYTVFAVFVVYICIFCRDILPIVPMALMAYFSPSVLNNPGVNPDSIFYPEQSLGYIVALLCVILLALAYALFFRTGVKRFFLTKRSLLVGFLILGVAFLLGGVGQEEYVIENLRYGLMLFASVFFLYYIFTAMLDWDKVPKQYLAWAGTCGGLVVAIELLSVYFTNNVISSNGTIIRDYIYLGWGIHNNIGCALIMFMPFAFYLATVRKYGFVYNIIGNFLYLAVIFSTSRNAMLMGAIVYVFCAVVVLVSKKNRMQNLAVYIAALLVLVFFVFVFWDIIEDLFKTILELGISDNGREHGYKRAWEWFQSSVFIGKGFYVCDTYEFSKVEAMTFIPPRWHNTVLQLLASCGVIGLEAYLFHRVQTLVLFFKKMTISKAFIGISVLALLLSSLLDCHFFNLGPGLLYSAFLAFAERDEETTEEGNMFLFWKKQERTENT